MWSLNISASCGWKGVRFNHLFGSLFFSLASCSSLFLLSRCSRILAILSMWSFSSSLRSWCSNCKLCAYLFDYISHFRDQRSTWITNTIWFGYINVPAFSHYGGLVVRHWHSRTSGFTSLHFFYSTRRCEIWRILLCYCARSDSEYQQLFIHRVISVSKRFLNKLSKVQLSNISLEHRSHGTTKFMNGALPIAPVRHYTLSAGS